MKKYIYSSVGFLTTFLLYRSAHAAELLPRQITDLFGLLGDEGSGTSEFVSSRVRMLLLLGLGVLVLAAVIYAAMAAFKYIQSQGDPGKIEEAGKAVKAIFTGLAVLMVAIVGIILVFVFFGAGLFGTSTYQTCVSAANSQGCISCQSEDGGLPENWDTIKFDTDAATAVSKSSTPAATGSNLERCITCEWVYFAVKREAAGGATGIWKISDVPDYCKE